MKKKGFTVKSLFRKNVFYLQGRGAFYPYKAVRFFLYGNPVHFVKFFCILPKNNVSKRLYIKFFNVKSVLVFAQN